MKLHTHGLTDTGLLRPQNEDAYLIDRDRGLCAVADGLGGLPGGALASRRSLELLVELIDGRRDRGEPIALEQVVMEISETVRAEGWAAHPLTGMATTLTAGCLEGDALRLAHAGDSAAYLERDGALAKLTVDHTMEQELLEKHGPNAKRGMPAHFPHTLTRCVGQNETLDVDIAVHPLRDADRLLWCTDGVTKVLPDATIAEILQGEPSPESVSERLRAAAYERGAPDNIALVVAFAETDSSET